MAHWGVQQSAHLTAKEMPEMSGGRGPDPAQPVSFKQEVSSVEYRVTGSDYFQKRALKRYAGVWSLWALAR